MMELPGQRSLVVKGVVVGLFEEEEEVTSIASKLSKVIKVEGEDPDTPSGLGEPQTGEGGKPST